MKSHSALPLLLLTGLFLPGCASVTRQEAPVVTVSFNDPAPASEKRTYAILCDTGLVRQWFMSAPQALMAFGEALEKQGYVEADSNAAATHVIKVNLGFGPRNRRPRMETENPDSVRYQNVAAMAGGGRYSQILTERSDTAGSILMGPNGEVIPTGGWKTIMEEADRLEKFDPSHYDILVLSAWDNSKPLIGTGPHVWQIMVRVPVDDQVPNAKRVGFLLDQASARLNAGLAATVQPALPTPPASEPAK